MVATFDVTVVIPTISTRAVSLRRALTSVVGQTTQPSAIVVEYDHEHTGAAATRNRALDKVNTEWIAWLDDDDELLPNHVAALGAVAATHADVALVYPRPHLVGGPDPTAVAVNGRWQLPWGVPFGPEQRTHLLTRGSFIPMTHMVRTSSVRDVGGFPATRRLPDGRLQGEDERYLVALLENDEQFVHVDEVTWIWNSHAGSTAGLPDRW